MAKIVIIGAGLTGISTAYHLEKRLFFDYQIFEKEAEVGGLCRSIRQDGFTFDYTGHLLHVNSPYFLELLRSIIGLDTFNTIKRRSYIFSHDRYTRYPYQINLFGLPLKTIVECIEGFVTRNAKKKRKIESFYEWSLRNFGKGITKSFFVPYQQKIFSYPIKKISASWTGRFVPKASLGAMIQGAICDNKEENIGYNAHFLYPKSGGIASWVSKFSQKIKKPIHTTYEVDAIYQQDKIVSFTNGHVESYDILINTMPLDNFLERLKESSSSNLKKALNHLRCNSVINFNLGIDRKNLTDKHWIYFPEQKFPFYRIGFPHNFTPLNTPQHCSSLYGEWSFLRASKKRIESITHTAIQSVQKLFNIKNEEIINKVVIPIKHAYVIYDFWRDNHLPQLLTKLEDNNIYSVGRYGAWKYASMQEAVLDGKNIAEQLTVVPALPYIHQTSPSYKKPVKQLG